jgi:hypothetical protein
MSPAGHRTAIDLPDEIERLLCRQIPNSFRFDRSEPSTVETQALIEREVEQQPEAAAGLGVVGVVEASRELQQAFRPGG